MRFLNSLPTGLTYDRRAPVSYTKRETPGYRKLIPAPRLPTTSCSSAAPGRELGRLQGAGWGAEGRGPATRPTRASLSGPRPPPHPRPPSGLLLTRYADTARHICGDKRKGVPRRSEAGKGAVTRPGLLPLGVLDAQGPRMAASTSGWYSKIILRKPCKERRSGSHTFHRGRDVDWDTSRSPRS